MRRACVLMFVLLLATMSAVGQAPESLEQRLRGFVTAFDQLDWPRFQSFFEADATVFHPAAPNVKRTDSREMFEKAWLGVFERIRKNSGKTQPPYMVLQPKDLKVEYLADGVALVTFHLDDGEVLGRRTMVWRRTSGEWKIVHIHASNFDER